MTDDITSQVLRIFESRLETDPGISTETREILLKGQRTNDFGDDEEILNELIVAFEDEQ